MRRIRSVALNTFRETFRQKLLVLVVIYVGILLLSTFVLSPLSVGAARGKIITDIGLAAISIFGVLTAIVVGSSLVHKEIDKKAIYMVITRPVSRHEYILGKFSGIVLSLAVLMISMAAVMSLMIIIGRGNVTLAILTAAYLSILEVVVMSAVIIFFSTFTTPILTSFFSLCFFVTGSLSSDLREFANRYGGTAMRYMMQGFYYLLPNFKVFNLRHEAVHDLRFSYFDIWLTTLYAVVYCAVILYFAYLIFRRREFT
ncbi:MAG: ABC transporter permease subunit [Candidatus Krumholzibacteriota bacterium]|nr:ABC transporter permease subunit [Candidatus Krumholzibacteriota bacterium]